jgi:hypothetical protein
MPRATLLARVAGLMLLLGFAISATGRRGGGTSRGPVTQQELMERGVAVGPAPRGAGRGILPQDQRLAYYLRTVMVYMESMRAEMGTYPSDVRKIAVDRPANVQLLVIRVGEEGIRMSAIDNVLERQCDVFAGDSARWAFGYAYDTRMPGCGKLR